MITINPQLSVPSEVRMTKMEEALDSLKIGDIFHARSTSGAKLTCIVTDVDHQFIIGKRITSEFHYCFDRKTGLMQDKSINPCIITTVAQLPEHIQAVLLEINLKYGGPPDPQRWKADPTSRQLTLSQIDALSFASDFCETHTISCAPEQP